MMKAPKRRLQRSVQLTAAQWRWLDKLVRKRQQEEGGRYTSVGSVLREMVSEKMAAGEAR